MSVYLDHNATAPVHPEVTQALISVLEDIHGNPSAPYALGVDAKRVLARARENASILLGTRRKEVFFTSGGTEANNLALNGVFFARRDVKRPHLILSSIEHPSVAATCQWLADRHGAELTVIDVPSTGVINPADVVNALRPETVLVTVMHANNETGAIQPVEIIGHFLEGVGVHFHVDGVQAAGRVPVDVQAIACDSYSVSAHKFGGLKGCGALILREGGKVEAILRGGHQEKGLRAGTENVPGIAAMGKAAEIAARDLQKNRTHCLRMRAVFDALAVRLPDCSINGDKTLRLPNTTNLLCRDADAMSIVMALSRCSCGAICVLFGVNLMDIARFLLITDHRLLATFPRPTFSRGLQEVTP